MIFRKFNIATSPKWVINGDVFPPPTQSMSFWKNVENELEYQNISRKDLAKRAGFVVSGISLGITNNSVPYADVAVRIADVLNVSVEYLVTGKNNEKTTLSPQLNQLFSNILQLDDYDLESIRALVQRIVEKEHI